MYINLSCIVTLSTPNSPNIYLWSTNDNIFNLSQMKFYSSKLKEFADDNFKFDENGRNFFKWVESTVGKGEIPCYEQFLLFQQCYQKTLNADR